MKKSISKLESKYLFEKYIIAIQDLNRAEKLETKISSWKVLGYLRDDRIDDCHYLNDKDSSILYNDKRQIMEEKVKNMPPNVRKMFDKKYPNLLNDISPHIVSSVVNVSKHNREDIEEWWDE